MDPFRYPSGSLSLFRILLLFLLSKHTLAWDPDMPGGLKLIINGETYSVTTDLCSGGVFFKQPVHIELICMHGYFLKRPNGCSMKDNYIISGQNYACMHAEKDKDKLIQAFIPVTNPDQPLHHTITLFDDPSTLKNLRRYTYVTGIEGRYEAVDTDPAGAIIANSHKTPEVSLGKLCYEGKTQHTGSSLMAALSRSSQKPGSVKKLFEKNCDQKAAEFTWGRQVSFNFTEGYSGPDFFQTEFLASLEDFPEPTSDKTDFEIWGGLAYCMQANVKESRNGSIRMEGITPSIESLKPLCGKKKRQIEINQRDAKEIEELQRTARALNSSVAFDALMTCVSSCWEFGTDKCHRLPPLRRPGVALCPPYCDGPPRRRRPGFGRRGLPMRPLRPLYPRRRVRPLRPLYPRRRMLPRPIRPFRRGGLAYPRRAVRRPLLRRRPWVRPRPLLRPAVRRRFGAPRRRYWGPPPRQYFRNPLARRNYWVPLRGRLWGQRRMRPRYMYPRSAQYPGYYPQSQGRDADAGISSWARYSERNTLPWVGYNRLNPPSIDTTADSAPEPVSNSLSSAPESFSIPIQSPPSVGGSAAYRMPNFDNMASSGAPRFAANDAYKMPSFVRPAASEMPSFAANDAYRMPSFVRSALSEVPSFAANDPYKISTFVRPTAPDEPSFAAIHAYDMPSPISPAAPRVPTSVSNAIQIPSHGFEETRKYVNPAIANAWLRYDHSRADELEEKSRRSIIARPHRPPSNFLIHRKSTSNPRYMNKGPKHFEANAMSKETKQRPSATSGNREGQEGSKAVDWSAISKIIHHAHSEAAHGHGQVSTKWNWKSKSTQPINVNGARNANPALEKSWIHYRSDGAQKISGHGLRTTGNNPSHSMIHNASKPSKHASKIKSKASGAREEQRVEDRWEEADLAEAKAWASYLDNGPNSRSRRQWPTRVLTPLASSKTKQKSDSMPSWIRHSPNTVPGVGGDKVARDGKGNVYMQISMNA